MPKDSQTPPGVPGYRARFANLWALRTLEVLTIAALVAGALWFVGSKRSGQAMTGALSSPELWVLVVVLTGVGVIGNLALYYLGGRGTGAVFDRFPYLEGERWERIGGYYRRWGSRILLLSAIPTLGTFLTTAAGAFGVERNAFLLWVFISKLVRNWLLLLVFHGVFLSL